MFELRADHVLGYLGWRKEWTVPADGDPDDVVPNQLVTNVFNMTYSRAQSYTRGRGFSRTVDVNGNSTNLVAHDLATVIITAASRMLLNREQFSTVSQLVVAPGKVAEPVDRAISGHEWSLAELLVLNRWRVRAM